MNELDAYERGGQMSAATSTPNARRTSEPLDHDFKAVLERSPSNGGWTYS
jgi:hypothetical protein